MRGRPDFQTWHFTKVQLLFKSLGILGLVILGLGILGVELFHLYIGNLIANYQ